MSGWTVWEWLAYICLFIGAAILAADTGFKASAIVIYLPFINSAIWGFAPLFFVIVATVILILREWDWLKGSNKFKDSRKWKDSYVPRHKFVGRKYRNEKVVLDDCSYIGCEFINVTFVYNGTTPLNFSDNRIIGPPNISSENLVVLGTMVLLYGLGVIVPDIKVETAPGSKVEPVRRISSLTPEQKH